MVWLVVLLAVAGIGLIICEVFVPGGVLGLLGAAALIGSIVVAFTHLPPVGIVLTVILIPIGSVAGWLGALRVLPKTRFGKTVFLSSTQEGIDVLADTGDQYTKLIGKRGVAQSYLRPSGVVEIDGERVDVVTEGEFVEAGTPIEVLALEGNHLVVRAIEEK